MKISEKLEMIINNLEKDLKEVEEIKIKPAENDTDIINNILDYLIEQQTNILISYEWAIQDIEQMIEGEDIW